MCDRHHCLTVQMMYDHMLGRAGDYGPWIPTEEELSTENLDKLLALEPHTSVGDATSRSEP